MKKYVIAHTLLISLMVFLYGSEIACSQSISWQYLSAPFGTVVNAICIAPDGTVFVGTDNESVYRTTNNGINWIKSDSGITDNTIKSFAVNSKGAIYVGTFSNVFRSSDIGRSWVKVSAGLDKMNPGFINSLAIDDSDHIYAGTNGSGIYRLVDSSGAHWIPIFTGMFTIYSIVINPNEYVFAGGGVDYTGGAYRSTNNGQNWTASSIPGIVKCMSHDSHGNIYAGITYNSVYRSTDNGDSWVQTSNGLVATFINALTINSKDRIFAGTERGVFFSSDSGNYWTPSNIGLTNLTIHALATDSNGYVYASTDSGMFRTNQSTTSVEEKTRALPTIYSLDQNYPNPFNPSTTISFSLSSQSYVSLKIYDIIGREVTTLVSEVLSPGVYSRQWNAERTSSGIYFYRLHAATYIETKKLMLLK